MSKSYLTTALDKDKEKEYNKNSTSFASMFSGVGSALRSGADSIVRESKKEISDTDAEKMVDFLYDDKNVEKTQSFLLDNGYVLPSERWKNMALYGEQEEKKRTVSMFKNQANDVLNPTLPTQFDREFLSGFMGEEREQERYNQKVMQNAYRRSVYADVFRGSPFEKMFLGEQPAVMAPVVQKAPIKAQNQNLGKMFEVSATNAMGTASDIVGVPGTVLNAADNQLKNFDVVRPSSAPVKFNAARPGSIDMKLPIKNDVLDMRFTYNDGKVSVTGKNHLLQKYADNADVTDFINKVDGAEAPKFVRSIVNNADDVAKLKNVAKTGQALGTASTVLGGAEVLAFGYNDIKDDGKLSEETVKKTGSFFGDLAGSSVGAKAGASLGSAIGTAICPGLGTIIGGFIGGIAGGILGGIAGDKLGEAAGGYVGEDVADFVNKKMLEA